MKSLPSTPIETDPIIQPNVDVLDESAYALRRSNHRRGQSSDDIACDMPADRKA